MKLFRLILLPLLLYVNAIAESPERDVRAGDDIETVYEILGQPQGMVGSERFRILHFPRGEVYLRNGTVERTALISEEELAAREARARELEIARENERLQRLAEGRALRDEKLADDAFRDSSPRDRLAFWNTFQRHYPEVNISFELEIVRAEVEEKERQRRLEQQRQEQILTLQQRLREAEIRAEEVERQNRRLEEERQHRREQPRVTHVSPVYVIHPHAGQPPTEKEKDAPPPSQPKTLPPREVFGEPARDPTPFERAREYRHERGNIRNEARYGSS